MLTEVGLKDFPIAPAAPGNPFQAESRKPHRPYFHHKPNEKLQIQKNQCAADVIFPPVSLLSDLIIRGTE